MVKAICSFIMILSIGDVALACDISSLDKKKYAYSIATGKTVSEAKRKALDEYFVGKDRKVPVAVYDVVESAVVGSEGASFKKTVNANTNLWIEDFVVRTCKEKSGYRVAVIFPKKNVHYYAPIPKEITLAMIRKMDKGYGVAINHFIGNFKVEPEHYYTKCYGKIPSIYCVYPFMPRWSVHTHMIKNVTTQKYHTTLPMEKFKRKSGDIVVFKNIINDPTYRDPTDRDTEGFLLELASRDGAL